MAGKFLYKKFSEIELSDPFFDSLKEAYPGNENSSGFEEWFKRKAGQGKDALVYEDKLGVAAFVVLKPENEPLQLREEIIPAKERMKISTLKIGERHRGERLGEGAIGLTLWKWQESGFDEIYVTVFDKQTSLIAQIERFGFCKVGYNLNGEAVYLKSKLKLDFSDPYKSFPFIKGDFEYGGYVIIDDNYHDSMFAYSELANQPEILKQALGKSVRNGLSKIYVGQALNVPYKIGEPVFIYRKYTQGNGKKYRSCVTSFAVVTNVIQAKRNGTVLVHFDDLIKRIGNKSVFDEKDIKDQYINYKNVTVVEMLYYGYFGAGNNVNMDWLDRNGCWSAQGQYPTSVHLSTKQFKKILTEGKINVSNVIID